MSRIMLGTPCFAEGYELLVTALQSFCSHNVDVVAIDNGASADVKRALVEMAPRISIIRNERNVYVNPAWNQLAERFLASDAEVLVVANADLVAAPGWAESLLMRHAQAQPGARELWFAEWVADLALVMREHPPSAAEGVTRSSGGGFFAMSREAAQRAFPIPSELRLWYGDAWIHNLLLASGYRSVGLRDVLIWQQLGISTASLPLAERTAIMNREKVAWDAYLGAVCQTIGSEIQSGTMNDAERIRLLELARATPVPPQPHASSRVAKRRRTPSRH